MAPASPRAIAIAVAIAAVGSAVLWWPVSDAPPTTTVMPAPQLDAGVAAHPQPRERRAAAVPAPEPSPASPAAEPVAAPARTTAREALALALRSAAPTAEARRSAVLDALAASGPAEPAHAAAATARIAAWHAALGADIAGAIELGAVRCHRAGCAAAVAFATPDAYAMAQDHLRRRPAADDDGGRMQTPATPRGDGWLVADWIALAPE
jgi:hypothetical protein